MDVFDIEEVHELGKRAIVRLGAEGRNCYWKLLRKMVFGVFIPLFSLISLGFTFLFTAFRWF